MGAIIKRFKRPNIILKGHVKQRDLINAFAQGSVFCLPSIEEGLATVILQAMACSLPVICTANSGGGDIVREGIDGFVVPIRDVGSLRERLSFMRENMKKCTEMGVSARERIMANFTMDHYGESAISTYERMSSQNG